MSNKRISIKDMAEACGVSTATISRAFKEGTEINEETRQAILKKAQQMGYSPNPTAKSLRMKQSSNIGLILPESPNRLYWSLIKKLDISLQKHGLKLLIRFTQSDDPDAEKEALLSMYQANVEAVAILPRKDGSSKKILELYKDFLHPIQIFHSVYPEYDSIRIDDNKGIYDAVNYLLQNNHRRILFLGKPSRLNEYQAALSQLKLPYNPDLANPSFYNAEPEEIYQIIQQQQPTAILAIGTPAEKALWTLLKHNIQFPQDISFLVYDDVSWVSNFDITAIAHPMDEIVDKLTQIILKRFSDQIEPTATPEHVVFSPELVIRSSVKKLSTDC